MWKTKICMSVLDDVGLDEVQQVKLLKKCGFDGFACMYLGREKTAELRAAADECGMIFKYIHAQFGNVYKLWEGDSEQAGEVINELKECIDACRDFGVPIMVCHVIIGFERHSPNENGIKNFTQVVEYAEKNGVKIAFENTEGEEYLAAVMEAFKDKENVGFCWDTGHQLCYNHGDSMTDLYGDRLMETHLNDNLGISDFEGSIRFTDDLHMLPFDGIANWNEIASELKRCNFTDTINFELNKMNRPGRLENTVYKEMPLEIYLTEAYKRACRVAALMG